MKLIIIESPYAGTSAWPLLAWVQRLLNVRYARACVRDSLERGEAPIASHLLYTQTGILRDENPKERQWGIDAGLAWHASADYTAVYEDRGITRGMKYGITFAKDNGQHIEYRRLRK